MMFANGKETKLRCWLSLLLRNLAGRLSGLRYGVLAAVGLALLSGLTQTALAEPVSVRVGGYLFPPYVDVAANGDAQGLAPDLLAALNRSQSDFHFRFVLTSPNRRFQDFAVGRFDMILFEDLRWGWANTMMQASRPFLRDADVFVSQSHRDQSYFQQLGGKRIYAVRGYHYAFAGYNGDPDQLKQQFGVELLDPRGPSLDRGLQALANGQADLMMVTESYLHYYFQQRPDMRERLLMAERSDSAYQHGALVRRQHALTASHFDQLLDLLRRNGELQQLASHYGINHLVIGAEAP